MHQPEVRPNCRTPRIEVDAAHFSKTKLDADRRGSLAVALQHRGVLAHRARFGEPSGQQRGVGAMAAVCLERRRARNYWHCVFVLAWRAQAKRRVNSFICRDMRIAISLRVRLSSRRVPNALRLRKVCAFHLPSRKSTTNWPLVPQAVCSIPLLEPSAGVPSS